MSYDKLSIDSRENRSEREVAEKMANFDKKMDKLSKEFDNETSSMTDKEVLKYIEKKFDDLITHK